MIEFTIIQHYMKIIIILVMIFNNQMYIINGNNNWFQLNEEINSITWDKLLSSINSNNNMPDTIKWSYALKKLTNKRRPVIIKNSPITNWKAMKLWKNTSYITNSIPTVYSVRKSSHPTFVYEDKSRMLGKYVDPGTKTKSFDNYKSTTKYKKVSMPTNKYLNKCGMLEDNNNNGNNKKVKTAIMAKKEVEINNNKKKNKKKANKKRKRKQYYYFSRRLSEAKELDILLQDAEPRTFLQFRNVIDKWNHDNENNTEDKNTINDTTTNNTNNNNEKDSSSTTMMPIGDVHFWLTGTNITASAHYDRDHNFFAQIIGKKRFVIFHPNQWNHLCVHPFYHPRDRQSQYIYYEHDEKIINPETKRFLTQVQENKIKSYGYADLEPGDLLYIPPFWWHRVETLQASIGINTWSKAIETDMSTSLNDLNLPKLLVEAKGKDKAAASSLYLRFIVKHLKLKCNTNAFRIKWNAIAAIDHVSVKKKQTGSPSIYQFIAEIVESRYVKMGLIERMPGFNTCQFWDHGRCPKQHSFNAVELRQLEDHSKKIVDHIIITLNQILRKGDKNGKHSTGIVGLILGDYIERVATFTVGPDRVCPFLRCVSHPLGWERQQLKDRILDWGDDENQEL